MTTTAKFGRNYLLSIQGRDGSKDFYTAQPPITMEFDIRRNMWSGANTGKFRIYNLAENKRNNLFHVRCDSAIEHYQRVSLAAGYNTQGDIPLVFIGNVRTCSTQRSGVDWITEVDAFDAGIGMLLGQITYAKKGKGWTAEEVLRTLVGTMPFTKFGAIGNIKIKNSRGISMAGNAWDISARLTDAGVMSFIDKGVAYFLKENEYLDRPGQMKVIVGPDNIIGTPRIDAGTMEVDIIFEPSVYVGQQVEVSSLQTIYNNTYIVRGIHHRGTMSEAVCGDAITTLVLWTGVLGVPGKPKMVAVQAK